MHVLYQYRASIAGLYLLHSLHISPSWQRIIRRSPCMPQIFVLCASSWYDLMNRLHTLKLLKSVSQCPLPLWPYCFWKAQHQRYRCLAMLRLMLPLMRATRPWLPPWSRWVAHDTQSLAIHHDIQCLFRCAACKNVHSQEPALRAQYRQMITCQLRFNDQSC